MQTTETAEQQLTNEGGARGAPTPRERLAAYSARIGECQQQMKRTLPAAVELGRCALQVRDEGLFDLVGKRDIYVWMYEVHGIRTTQAKTLLKVGESFTPERVEGRDVTLDCLHQITRAPVALRPLLIDLAEAERIRGVGLMRRCCAEAAAVYGGPGDEERAMRAARAVLSGPAPLSEQARVQAAMGRVERVVGKLEEASDPALLDDVVRRLSVLLEQVKALRGETIETAEARQEGVPGLVPAGSSSSSSSSSSSRGPEGHSQEEAGGQDDLSPLMKEIWAASAGVLPADLEARGQVRKLVKELDRHLTLDRVRGDIRAVTRPLRELLGPCLLRDCCLIADMSRRYMGSDTMFRFVLLRQLATWEETSVQVPEMLNALVWHMIGACQGERSKLEEKRQGMGFMRQALEVYERHPEVRPTYLIDLLLHLEQVLRALGSNGEADEVKMRLAAEQERGRHLRRLRRRDEEEDEVEEEDAGEEEKPVVQKGRKGEGVPPVSGLTPLVAGIWAGSTGAMPVPENREEAVRQMKEMDRHLAAGRERSAREAAMALLALLPEVASPLWVGCMVLTCLVDIVDLGPGSVKKVLGQLLRVCEKNPGWEMGRLGGLVRHLRGICLIEDKGYKEALPLLRQALEIYEQEPDVPVRHRMDLLQHLEAVLRAQGSEEEADGVRARLEIGLEWAGGFPGLVEEEDEDPEEGEEDGE